MSNSDDLFQLQREVGEAGGSEASDEAKERFKLRVTGLGSLGLKDSIAGGFREMAGSGDKSGGGGRLSVARPAVMARERVVGEAHWTVPTAGGSEERGDGGKGCPCQGGEVGTGSVGRRRAELRKKASVFSIGWIGSVSQVDKFRARRL